MNFKLFAPEISRLTRSRLNLELLIYSPLFLSGFLPLFIQLQRPAVFGLPLIAAGALVAVITKYTIAKKNISTYLSYPHITGIVKFRSSIKAKFTTTFVDIESAKFTGERHCAYLNVKASQLQEPLEAYLFFQDEKPKLIVSFDMKTICIVD